MHDQQKKERRVLSPEAKAAAAAEHERVGVLYRSVLAASNTRHYTADVLADTKGLLLAVPEAYAAYNCRRLALEAVHAAASSGASPVESAAAQVPTRQEWLVQELKLNNKVLQLNHKNYSAFLHRHWIFDQLETLATNELQQVASAAAGADAAAASTATPVGATTASRTFALLSSLLQRERAECEQLLQRDERNFHAWNYRRWVQVQERRAAELAASYAGSAPAPAAPPDATASSPMVLFTPEEAAELAFTTQKIKSNFSNYSAWHQRSLALQSAVTRWQRQLESAAAADGDAGYTTYRAWQTALLTQLKEDVGFLEQAVYCDPNDQSAWFYAPFVFQLLRGHCCGASGHDGDEDGAAAAALEDAFMNAVIDLVAEVDRVGTEEECYMPYYFLLDHLVTLQSTADSGRAAAALERHLTALCERVPAVGSGGDAKDARRRAFDFLHARLWKADALRRCLYDDLLRRAMQGCA